MRTLSVIAISLLLVSARQLGAQTAESPDVARDPFGSFGDAPGRSERNARPSVSRRTPKSVEQSKKRTTAQSGDLFPAVRSDSAATASRQRIEQALSGETAFDYLDQPLKDVIEDISFTHEIPIVIDVRALDDFGVDTDTPITRSLKGVSLRSALRLTLRNLDLAFVIRDEVLQITTMEVADATLSTRFYHVADLLPPNGEGKVLVELIKTSVLPDSWSGIGAITFVDHLESLVIRHHDEAFHEIEELLATTKQIIENRQPKGRPQGHDPFD